VRIFFYEASERASDGWGPENESPLRFSPRKFGANSRSGTVAASASAGATLATSNGRSVCVAPTVGYALAPA